MALAYALAITGKDGLKMDKRTANRIYDILVENAGASEKKREKFIFYHVNKVKRTHTKWRFEGSLGFGGKFWVLPNGYRVTCYEHNKTPERIAIIKNVNSLLESF